MPLRKIISAGTIGTTAMTLFSIAVSRKRKKKFSEPELLQKVFRKAGGPKSLSVPASWGIHYGIGYMFLLAYDKLWRTGRIKPGIMSGALLGSLSGILGILIWKTTLRSMRILRPLSRKEYFLQLFLAHVIFAISSAIAWKRQDGSANIDDKKKIR